MCQRVECPKCKKPTYAGCGMHIEQVLGNVPRDQRCSCRTAAQPKAPGEPSALERLFKGITGG